MIVTSKFKCLKTMYKTSKRKEIVVVLLRKPFYFTIRNTKKKLHSSFEIFLTKATRIQIKTNVLLHTKELSRYV